MRFTIRRMMLAIAVLIVSMYIGLSYRRSGDYPRQAQFYARLGQAALNRARNFESGTARLDSHTAEQSQNATDQARRLAAYWFRLNSKYEWAVYLPWLPVDPDPPPFGSTQPNEVSPSY